jgi:long-chain acyl-CoA synthetase
MMNKLVYADLLHHACTTYASRPCLHIKREGRYATWSYGDLQRDLNKLTSVVKKNGLRRGKNGAVIGENSPEWVIAYHAILLTGACTVPIDPNIPADEIESIISVTEAEIVFCAPVYAQLFRTLQKRHRFLKKIVILGAELHEGTETFGRCLAGGEEAFDAFGERFKPDDPMVIIFTSGTTGKAKGVVLSQKNFTAVGNHALPRMKLGADDTVLSVLPLHHVFGFSASMAGPLCGGMDVVMVPSLKGPLILEALRDKGVTWLPAVPKMIALFYEGVLHNVKKKGPLVSALFGGMQTVSAVTGTALGNRFKRRLFGGVHQGFGGKLKLIISGGAALSKKYWNGFSLMGFTILEGYGLTETFGPITVCPGEDPRLGSVGPVLAENEVKIADPNEEGIGEVLLRGTCVFSGYYKNETLTAEAFDDQGWFHTGDLGHLDGDGFLHIAGRKKDVIVLDTGKNVYPDEVEEYYERSPKIEEIGVFGIKLQESEIVAAAIVPSKEIRKTSSIKAATETIYHELVKLGKELPVHRRIADFVILYHPLPRTTTRKLKKPELVKLYTSIKRRAGNRTVVEEQLSVIEMALMESSEYKGVVGSLVAASPHIDQRIITPRADFEIDLGLDSLSRIELLSAIESAFGITILDDVFDKMETIADLVSLVKEQKASPVPVSVEKVMGLKERILDMSFYSDAIPGPEQGLRLAALAPLRKASILLKSVQTTYADASALQRTGPFIFAALHASVFDAFWLLESLPREVAAKTFFLNEPIPYPKFPYAFYRGHVIRVSSDPIETLKIALALLRSGKNLIIFPEGKIAAAAHPGEFKSGIGFIARETGATIFPVKSSAGEKRRKQRMLSFGKPFTFNELVAGNGVKPDASPQDIANVIRAKIMEV